MAGESLTTLRTSVRSDLRDTAGATWTDTEINDLVNSGIDWLNGLYPKEAIQTTAYTQPISGAVFSVALSAVNWPFRVDVYTDADKYRETLWPSSSSRRTTFSPTLARCASSDTRASCSFLPTPQQPIWT